MTTRTGLFARLREWLWRGDALRELRERKWSDGDQQRLREAAACQTLASRALSGLEPVPSATREAVAQPLLSAAVAKCLPLLQPGVASVDALFDDAAWQERLAQAGVAVDAQPAVRSFLLAGAPAGSRGALTVLGALLDTLQAERRAISALLWRRLRITATFVLLFAGLVAGISLLVSPPEGPDLGVGRAWNASSNYPGFAGSGIKQAKPTEVAFFSTNDDVSPWWKLDLKKPAQLGSVTVVNRGDCCPERAVPFVVELSDDGEHFKEVARRTQTFRTWTATFPATKARYVRLRALRRTYLHFKDVRIHAAK